MHALGTFRLLRPAALAALILSVAPTAFAQQQRPQPPAQLVEEVNVSGTRRLAREEIFRHIKTRPGGPYDREQVQRDLQALADTRAFDRRSLRVVTETGERGGVVVSFEVRELPVIESVKFEGLRRADEAALVEGLRQRKLALDGGGVYEPEKIAEALNVIDELLYGRGWREVRVETRVEQIASGSVKLTFVVSGQPPLNVLPKRLDRPARRDAIA